MSQESKTASQRTPTALLNRHWRAIVAVLAALPFLTIGVGVWLSRSAADGAITRSSDLQKLPEEHLFYPGATLVGSFGNDYERGVWGSNAASSGHTLGADASTEEVLAFYEHELTSRGWQKVQVAGIGSDEIKKAVWRKDGITLRISILRKNDPQSPAALNVYQTPYRMVVFPPVTDKQR